MKVYPDRFHAKISFFLPLFASTQYGRLFAPISGDWNVSKLGVCTADGSLGLSVGEHVRRFFVEPAAHCVGYGILTIKAPSPEQLADVATGRLVTRGVNSANVADLPAKKSPARAFEASQSPPVPSAERGSTKNEGEPEFLPSQALVAEAVAPVTPGAVLRPADGSLMSRSGRSIVDTNSVVASIAGGIVSSAGQDRNGSREQVPQISANSFSSCLDLFVSSSQLHTLYCRKYNCALRWTFTLTAYDRLT